MFECIRPAARRFGGKLMVATKMEMTITDGRPAGSGPRCAHNSDDVRKTKNMQSTAEISASEQIKLVFFLFSSLHLI